MTHPYTNKNKDVSLSAESVAAYLTENPDFFTKQPYLLKQLSIPHQFDGNVQSLIERQVNLLRDENNQLKKKIQNNQLLSKAKRHVQQQVYQYSFELLQADSIAELYRLLCKGLDRWFAAKWVKLFIFNVNILSERNDGVLFLGNASKLRYMFIELLNRNKPLCTSLQIEQLHMLFNADTDKVKSNLVIPIKQADWNGLFVLGSEQNNQYGIGEELDMLVYISELTSFKIQQLINA